MLKMNKLKWTLWITTLFLSTASNASHQSVGFEGSEHMAAGDQVKLSFYAGDEGTPGYSLHLPNGLKLSYGQLIALGDFYGIPAKPIAFGKTEAERKTRFIEAFNTLAHSAQVSSEVQQILEVIQKEKNEVEDGMARGENPEDIYQRVDKENNRQFNCITGGGCDQNWWTKPGRYIILASQDFDHFGHNAWVAYQTGHQVALEQAVRAYQTHDIKQLELAYAMDGFAAHYLTDRFAAGHIRTPRVELPTYVFPGVIGAILVSYMHGEDNQYGIHVHNQQGDQWIAYGDKYYFNPCNKDNLNMMHKTLQASANEIFVTFLSGVSPKNNSIYDFIPQPNETGESAHRDISSLFYWDDAKHKLYRRTDITNFYDKHWTTHWWGWSTLALLAKERGLPVELQAKLVESGYGKKALEEGLLTEISYQQFK